ncbi:MAG: PH domain-containing protein [Clostridiales bacterium]|jgi:uncharacterized membrane protein YdbT with pleckstrin-like domain|nr:PH domain-containing protein [Clostridiales bacterium]
MDVRWSDRKRTWFGLPWTFTKYTLTDEKLCIKTGFFTTVEEEIRLYRIIDMTLKRTLGQKIFGLGTIHVCSGDKTSPEFDIERVKDPSTVKELLSDLVEAERLKKKTIGREVFYDPVDDNDDDD